MTWKLLLTMCGWLGFLGVDLIRSENTAPPPKYSLQWLDKVTGEDLYDKPRMAQGCVWGTYREWHKVPPGEGAESRAWFRTFRWDPETNKVERFGEPGSSGLKLLAACGDHVWLDERAAKNPSTSSTIMHPEIPGATVIAFARDNVSENLTLPVVGCTAERLVICQYEADSGTYKVDFLLQNASLKPVLNTDQIHLRTGEVPWNELSAHVVGPKGEVLGYGGVADRRTIKRSVLFPFIWSEANAEQLQTLPNLPGFLTAIPADMNGDRIVGTATLPDDGYRAMIWNKNCPKLLATKASSLDSWAQALNSKGVIVGSMGKYERRAALWMSDEAYALDLNALISDSLDPWALVSTIDIDDQGRILAMAHLLGNSNNKRWALLIPVQ